MSIQPVSNAFRGTQAVTAGTRIGCGGDQGRAHHIHIQWDATFIGTFSFQVSDFPEVAIGSAVAGDFVPVTPDRIEVVAGSGTATATTITVTGGTAGGAVVDFVNRGFRLVATLVTCTTPGVTRITTHSKQ